MRIDGNGRVIGPRGSGVTQKTEGSSSRFSLEMPDESPEAAGAPSAAAVSGLEAMLALQSIEDPLLRRRRAMQRGRGLLDALDALKIGLIDGTVAAADLERLSSLVKQGRDRTDDAGLESVLTDIDLRAAVELAKLERRKP